jgi:hypothetical protein
MKTLRPGDLIAIKYWWGEHVGVIGSQNGRLTLISNSNARSGVCEEYLEPLILGNVWRACQPLSQFGPDLVIARARSKIGSRYDFWKWNCEDFAHWVFGLEPRSGQRDGLAKILAILGVGLVMAVAARSK